MSDGTNLLRPVEGELPAERIDELLRHGPVRIERIVSRGHVSPPGFWYDQEESEWVLLVAGQARVRIEGEGMDRELGPGDHLWLPVHCRHRVEWTDPDRDTIWLAIFVNE